MPADVVFRVGRAYGMTADRSVYLLDGPVDDLPSQQPALTVTGGRAVHDPEGLFGAA
jgi:hypothetical protein